MAKGRTTIKKILMGYFNLNKDEITWDKDDWEDEFIVKGDLLEVVTVATAIANERSMLDDELELFDYISSTHIGIYTYLGDSGYMFRWL